MVKNGETEGGNTSGKEKHGGREVDVRNGRELGGEDFTY